MFDSVSENILFFISGLGILQAVLLAALIYFHPRSDRSVNKFLALFVFCIALILSMPLVIWAITWQNSFFMEPVPLLGGPFLYLYIRSFKERITWRKVLPHIAFAFIYFVALYIPMNRLMSKYADAPDIPSELLTHPLPVILAIIRHLQFLFYYFLCRRALISYQRSIRQLYSETSRIDLSWVRWLVNGFLGLVIVSIVTYGLSLQFPEKFPILFLTTIAFATPYIYMSTYKGITQSTLWKSKPDLSKEIVEKQIHEAEEIEVLNKKTEKRTQAVDSKFEEINTRILGLMTQEKLYQETELTLQNLADKLNFPSYQVSQAINTGMQKSFYDLVNSYRVEEAKRLLTESNSRNYTILSVGFEAGFNSKTTFNTVFKKFTGRTPTEFRDEYSRQPAT